MRANEYEERHIENWEDLFQNQKDGWVYRGQRDVSWNLETTLERVCNKWGEKLNLATEIEQRVIREFQRRFHHYENHIPNKDALIEWLSLMQHYGAPTRLLDFSYSIYVAAYFALEKTEKDCAVWAINGKWAVKEAGKKHTRIKELIHDPIDEEKEQLLSKTIKKSAKKFVFPINPFRLNERLTLQKGVFMYPGDVKTSFEKNLNALDGYKKNVVKFIIPENLRNEFLKKLYDTNVTRSTLFPGLDGFAQSLSIYLPKLLMENPTLSK